MPGNFPKRGDVYWVCLEPALGFETKKTRPCLVVSNNKGNAASNTIIVAPITSKIKRVYSFEVQTVVLDKQGKVMLNQCRAIDKLRLGTKIGQLNEETMNKVDEALRITFELV
jgi:mRNA interferase MazF